MTFVIDLALVITALLVALAVKPWRGLAASGPPWPWVATAAALPALWAADHLVAIPLLQPLSGASLLMLMAGWPLAILVMLPGAALILAAGLPLPEVVHRLAWLGVMPATLAMLMGAAVRRWLPHHLFVYILGRGFFATAVAGALAGGVSAWLGGDAAGVPAADIALARWLAAFGDATLCGMLVAIFVAYRPHWLATYADRLYLPR